MSFPHPCLSAALLVATLCAAVPAQLETEDALRELAPTVEPARWAGPVDIRRRIGGHLGFLASDELGGRDTATVHGDITARYVASVFAAAGLEPGGDDGSYLQTYPLELSTLVQETAELSLRDGGGELLRAFRLSDDYSLRGYDAVGFDVSAPLLFAGHGLVDTDAGVNDYDGLDVEGRIVLILDGVPSERPDLRRAASWRTKQAAAQDRGAAALLTVVDEELGTSVNFMRYVRSLMERGSMALGGDMAKEASPFPRAYVSRVVAEAIFAAADQDLGASIAERLDLAGMGGFDLGLGMRLFAEVNVEPLEAANVAGLLRGSDPELADEVIVVSAHMDHVGVHDDGEVYNGADDNASGTTTILTAAELLTGSAPRRSVLFLGVSGEEKGLLGSKWWVAHPTVAIEAVVANVNIDMVGRNDPDSVGVTPSPDHEQYNSLVVEAVALGPGSGLEVGFEAGEGKYHRKVDEYYERSDHANFARAGVPVVFFFAGEHEDYHKPTDTLEKLDQRKIWRMVDLVARLIESVGNADQRPYRLKE